jgi:hypothetical protein
MAKRSVSSVPPVGPTEPPVPPMLPELLEAEPLDDELLEDEEDPPHVERSGGAWHLHVSTLHHQPP